MHGKLIKHFPITHKDKYFPIHMPDTVVLWCMCKHMQLHVDFCVYVILLLCHLISIGHSTLCLAVKLVFPSVAISFETAPQQV